MINDVIIIKIKSTSEECEEIREAGMFFEAIADVLNIAREDIEEITNLKENYDKSRSN